MNDAPGAKKHLGQQEPEPQNQAKGKRNELSRRTSPAGKKSETEFLEEKGYLLKK
jgi:hypothetical protein